MGNEWYEIRVKGQLPRGWSDWFDALDARHDPTGDSILSGPLPDQPALHGVLRKLLNLNLELVSVIRRSRQPERVAVSESARQESDPPAE